MLLKQVLQRLLVFLRHRLRANYLLLFALYWVLTRYRVGPFALLSYKLRSTVRHTKAAKTVFLPKKTNQNDFIALEDVVAKYVGKSVAAKDGSSFWLWPFLGNGDLQSVYTFMDEKPARLYYGRQLIYFAEDHGTASLDYVIPKPESPEAWNKALQYAPKPDQPRLPARTRYLTEDEITAKFDANVTKPLVIALHGLTGGSYETYLRITLEALMAKGFDAMVVNSRGCARTAVTTPQLFCALSTEDIRRVLKLIKTAQPTRRVYLVGFSLGSCILANFLGQEGDKCLADGAVCLSGPWDLHASTMAMNQDWVCSRLYEPTMAANIVRLIKNNGKMMNLHPITQAGHAIKGRKTLVRHVDAAYTAPYFGFDTSGDYYRSASPVNRLTSIRTPLLIVNALDDPIVHPMQLPYEEVRANPYTYMITTEAGGHLGWYTLSANGGRWFPAVVASFIEGLDKETSMDRSNARTNIKPRNRIFDRDRLDFNRLQAAQYLPKDL